MMKKLILSAFFALILGVNAHAQKEYPDYTTRFELAATAGKNDSSVKQTMLNLDFITVYGHVYAAAGKDQFTKKQKGEDKETRLSLGYGGNVDIGNKDAVLTYGLGAAMLIRTNKDSMPPINTVLYGASGYGYLSSEEDGYETELSVWYTFRPQNSSNDLKNNILSVKFDAKKFFGSVFGVGVKGKWNISTLSTNTQSYAGDTSWAKTQSYIAPFIALKAGNVCFKAGPVFRRTKYSVTAPGYLPYFEASNMPGAVFLSAELNFQHRKK